MRTVWTKAEGGRGDCASWLSGGPRSEGARAQRQACIGRGMGVNFGSQESAATFARLALERGAARRFNDLAAISTFPGPDPPPCPVALVCRAAGDGIDEGRAAGAVVNDVFEELNVLGRGPRPARGGATDNGRVVRAAGRLRLLLHVGGVVLIRALRAGALARAGKGGLGVCEGIG